MKTIQNNFILQAVFWLVCFSFMAAAQSTELTFPTAVTTSEINGIVKARDLGDSRLTSYFYTFDGGQGDFFINVVTKNFNGDIDVFASEGLRPLTKMVIYADAGESETGRLVYLRKPERLILRVEGRSPNDDPATFRIKFAGSFIASSEQTQQEAPTIARRDAESDIRVNSVGTIVAVIPKPKPSPKATPKTKDTVAVVPKPKPAAPTKQTGKSPAPTSNSGSPLSGSLAKKPASPVKPKQKTPAAKPEPPLVESPRENVAGIAPVTKAIPAIKDVAEVKTVLKKPSKLKAKKAAKPPPESKPDPMAGIRLVVQFKDGNVIERPMNEVTKFSVDKGVLTVTAKDGTTVKYSMLDVAKVTIE